MSNINERCQYRAQIEGVESYYNISWYSKRYLCESKQYFDVFALTGLKFSTFYKNTHFQVNITLYPARKILRKLRVRVPSNKSSIDQARLVRSRWLNIGLGLCRFFMDFRSSVHKPRVKKELGQYSAISWPHALVNNRYFFPVMIRNTTLILATGNFLWGTLLIWPTNHTDYIT